jgi:hypothetical protein
LIKGITVTLYERTQTGADAFGVPTYTETPVDVSGVLVAPTTDDAIVTDLQLYGKKSIYELYIPKGDNHNWTDVRVEFCGQMFRTFGANQKWIDANVPLKWNRRVKVERLV